MIPQILLMLPEEFDQIEQQHNASISAVNQRAEQGSATSSTAAASTSRFSLGKLLLGGEFGEMVATALLQVSNSQVVLLHS